jgi:hypothetical protein
VDKKALWLRVKGYEFDHLVPPSLWQQVVRAFGGADAATKAFADKLARKLGWSRPFALRAVAEYRKFVYLGMVSDFPVTPSKVIDQVWHEHQLFTQAYRQFCGEVLGRHFDHHPELIPADEQLANYQSQYHGTLELYRKEFNHDPPADIWLVPKFREQKPRQPRHTASTSEASAYGDVPLYTYFESDTGAQGGGSGFDAFDSGESGGGGSGADWSDSGASDTSGSDGGAQSCGGSSCSSGCGGGGGD